MAQAESIPKRHSPVKTVSMMYDYHLYTVEFHTSCPLRMTHLGKHWPKTTQCLVWEGHIVIGRGEVVKHPLDEENPEYAMTMAAKKAFKEAFPRTHKILRTELWNLIRSNSGKES